MEQRKIGSKLQFFLIMFLFQVVLLHLIILELFWMSALWQGVCRRQADAEWEVIWATGDYGTKTPDRGEVVEQLGTPKNGGPEPLG